MPERLLIAPQDIRTGDPTVATDIIEGYFSFGGQVINTFGRSPFTIDTGSVVWARQLHAFRWLRHLRATGDPRHKAQARFLVGDFLDRHARPAPGPPWETDIAARRMLAWLSQSPIILEGGDRAFYARFMEALAVIRFHLERKLAEGASGDGRLLAALALAEFGLCAPDSSTFQRQGSELLANEIAAQILADGGHISRNPQQLIDLLLDLLPLRQAYAARGIAAPTALLNAIDRMMPMLRLFRHGDGSLALFNGMGLTRPEFVATVLAYDDARAQPLLNAPYSGYQRLEGGATVVIVDAGAAPPQRFSGRAHGGCLAFELSSGRQRIVVNCGAPGNARETAREAARVTAAHSTLVMADTSSCRFATQTALKKWLGDEILSGPVVVTTERDQGSAGSTLRMTHDGYAARFGCLHARELTLAADGMSLEGKDAADPQSGARAVPFALRFHLHPTVAAEVVGDGAAILLDCADGSRWLFQADGPARLEQSVFFAAGGGPCPTLQIRVDADDASQGHIIHWVFRRGPSPSATSGPIPDA